VANADAVNSRGEDWTIDAFGFAANADVSAGRLDADEMPRLADECVEDFAPFEVRVAGAVSPRGKAGLEVWLRGKVQVMCQRCLKPIDLTLDTHAGFELARSEQEAEAQADGLDEDEVWDVVVGSEHFDLKQLCEDELMLAIPYAPMHESCEPAAPAEAGEKISPFAALAQLKKQ